MVLAMTMIARSTGGGKPTFVCQPRPPSAQKPNAGPQVAPLLQEQEHARQQVSLGLGGGAQMHEARGANMASASADGAIVGWL